LCADIADILFIHLHDLQLREQEFGQRQFQGILVETFSERVPNGAPFLESGSSATSRGR
jgi:hypothetical protein